MARALGAEVEVVGFPQHTVAGPARVEEAIPVPIPSFARPDGPSEIIRPGIDGLLVPEGDTGVLAAAMDALLRDEALRERLALRARGPGSFQPATGDAAVGRGPRGGHPVVPTVRTTLFARRAQPLTTTICLSAWTASVRSICAAITASMGL